MGVYGAGDCWFDDDVDGIVRLLTGADWREGFSCGGIRCCDGCTTVGLVVVAGSRE